MGQLEGGFHVDAAEHAVAANVGVNDGFDAVILEFFSQVNDFMAGQLAPAVGGDLAVLGVKADDDVAAKSGAGILQKTRVFNGCSTNDDVAQAGVKVALNGVEVTYAAAQLHVNFAADFRQDFLDGSFVFGFASKSAV